MDYLNIIIIALIVLFLLWRMLPAKGIRQITATELKNELLDKNKQFIDVRTPSEYKANHIKGFNNIPLQQLAQKSAELSRDREVVVICQSGMRSNTASKMLRKLSFNKVTNVKGGMSAWSSSK
ncbi:rhodanese-like domain-containing protein [Paenibacillus sp. GCM10028914]|uniref:rhodanese-like domain-containing protein n=1 Tax=Paenibacillus sp. GCM10028914 TaxID=3273416 RepID=UPI00360B0592